jgi:hypothetical protein
MMFRIGPKTGGKKDMALARPKLLFGFQRRSKGSREEIRSRLGRKTMVRVGAIVALLALSALYPAAAQLLD